MIIRIIFIIHIKINGIFKCRVAKNLELGTKFLPIHNQYQTKDGMIVLTTLTEKQFQRPIKNVLKKPELLEDPKFGNIIKHFNYVDELDEIIEKWSKNLTQTEAIAQLEAVRIPCGKVLHMNEVHDHPNLKERGMLIRNFDFSKWAVNKATIPCPLIKFSEVEGSVESIGPEFKYNNEKIYCGLLEYSQEELKQFQRKKLI